MSAGFDRRLLRARFGAAAQRYGEVAVLQREVESRLLESALALPSPPERIVDVGCGPGRALALLARRYRRSTTLGIDLAVPMLKLARKAGGFWRPLSVACGDAAALPLPDASVDLLFSSLCLQWLDDVPAVLDEFRRVLRPGGRMMLATFGPQTLIELRDAWAAAGRHTQVSPFPGMAALGDLVMAQGFRDPVLDRDLFTLSYASADDLVAELRAIGANNARADRSRGLAGRGAWQRFREHYEHFRDDEGRLPASYEVFYVQARAPEPGQPRRGAGGEIATIPVSAIRRRPPRGEG